MALPAAEQSAEAGALENAGHAQTPEPPSSGTLPAAATGDGAIPPGGAPDLSAGSPAGGARTDESGVSSDSPTEPVPEIDVVLNGTEGVAGATAEPLDDSLSTQTGAIEQPPVGSLSLLAPSYQPVDGELECLEVAQIAVSSSLTVADTSQGDAKIFNGEIMYLSSSGSPVYDFSGLDLSSLKAICVDMRGSSRLVLKLSQPLDHLLYFAKGSASVEVHFQDQATVSKVTAKGNGDPSLVLRGAGLNCGAIEVLGKVSWTCTN